MYTGQCLDWYADDADDDVCILPLITANDNSVIAKEVICESEYLPPVLELPFADFGLPEQDEPKTGEQSSQITTTRPRLCNTTEVRNQDEQQTPLNSFYSCTVCVLRFPCRSQLLRHQLLWHGGGLKRAPRAQQRCRLCRGTFSTVEQLASHLNAQHTNCPVCDICLTTFHDEATLEWHRKHHLFSENYDAQPTKYACDFCRKVCASSSHLHLHRKVHLEQKPYSCTDCGRTFSSSGNRQKHIARVHTHERKYLCAKCDESFIYPRQLKLHRERKHASQSGEDAPFEGPICCPCCRKTFSNGATLRNHQKTVHFDEKRSFECTHCAKRFKQATHLRNHLVTHTGIRAYGCEFCAKRFAMAGDLRVHRRIHTKEKPFRCDLCPAAFIMGKQLNKHRSITHGQKLKC